MRVAKPTAECLKKVAAFVNACEGVLEREEFGFTAAHENWEQWDDEDEDKVLMLKIRKAIASEEEIDEKDVDGRILAYEFLRSKYTNRLKHSEFVLNVLMDNVCDPMESTLSFHPSFYQNHVEPEQ